MVVVLLLVFDELDGNQFLVLVVKALDDLAKGAFTDDLDQLEPESDVVTLLNSVVAFLIIKAVVYQSLHVAGLDLVLVLTHVEQLFILLDLCLFEICQILISNMVRLRHRGRDWKFDLHVRSLIHRQLVPLRRLRNHRVHSLHRPVDREVQVALLRAGRLLIAWLGLSGRGVAG